MMFANFDFSLFDNQNFKEDSVREKIISPFLKHLGYSSSGSEKIIRSKNLKHPFVYIGTKKHKIEIVPDYVLETSNGKKWVLDAKHPREEIKKGKNVEQAYSYAMHPDIRALNYALCNGRELVVFHINNVSPILIVPIEEFGIRFDEIKEILSPLAFTNPKLLKFKPDFGLYMLKLGFNNYMEQYFYEIGIPSIVKINENLYSIFVNIQENDVWYALSLDFNKKCYFELLNIVPQDIKKLIENTLYSQPFKIDFDIDKIPTVNLKARISNEIIKNGDEEFCLLFVDNFFINL